MNLKKLIDVILTECSGKKALDLIQLLTLFNRNKGSMDYKKAASIISKELKTYALDELKLHKYPLDGKTKNWSWPVTYATDIYSGKLTVVEPIQELLCRYDETPECIIVHSNKCDTSAELVDVGPGNHDKYYKNKKIRNKIVLMSNTVFENYHFLKKYEALGVISYPSLDRIQNLVDVNLFDGIFPTHENYIKNFFGFSVTHKQGIKLRKLLMKGPVKVHAKIDSSVHEGNMEVIDARINGTTLKDEELLFIAHLCHAAPSANDNASGAAGVVELIRVISELIDSGILERPNRSFRFLLLPEFMGTLAWMKANHKLLANVKYCFNLDMIGEHPLKIGTPLEIISSAYSTPSILNDVVNELVFTIADHQSGIAKQGTKVPMNFRFKRYMGGSDHVPFTDAAYKIPSIMFYHEDPNYHSSNDTVDFCDPTELQRVIGLVGCTGYILATKNSINSNEFASILIKGIYNRYKAASNLLFKMDLRNNVLNRPISDEMIIAIGYAICKVIFKNEKDILLDFSRHIDSNFYKEMEKFLLNLITNEQKNLLNLWSHLTQISIEKIKKIYQDHSKKEIKIQRNFEGPYYFYDFLKLNQHPLINELENSLTQSRYWSFYHEMLNFIPKIKNVLDLTACLCIEFDELIPPKLILEILEIFLDKNILKENQFN